MISLACGSLMLADDNEANVSTASGSVSTGTAGTGATGTATTKPVKKLDKPEYPILILSKKVEDKSFSVYSAIQARPEYTQLPEKELLGLLAGEYNDFAAHIKKAVRDAFMTPGEKKLLISFDAAAKKISAEANNVPFSEFVSAIADCASLSLIVSDKLTIPVSMNASDVSARAAIETAAIKSGFEIEEKGGIISFKDGKTPTLWSVPLPDKAEPEQCRMYYNKKEDAYYGEIIFFHGETAAVHFIYVIEQKKMIYSVKKLMIFATNIPEK